MLKNQQSCSFVVIVLICPFKKNLKIFSLSLLFSAFTIMCLHVGFLNLFILPKLSLDLENSHLLFLQILHQCYMYPHF